jgi:hypothetical protein
VAGEPMPLAGVAEAGDDFHRPDGSRPGAATVTDRLPLPHIARRG